MPEAASAAAGEGEGERYADTARGTSEGVEVVLGAEKDERVGGEDRPGGEMESPAVTAVAVAVAATVAVVRGVAGGAGAEAACGARDGWEEDEGEDRTALAAWDGAELGAVASAPVPAPAAAAEDDGDTANADADADAASAPCCWVCCCIVGMTRGRHGSMSGSRGSQSCSSESMNLDRWMSKQLGLTDVRRTRA